MEERAPPNAGSKVCALGCVQKGCYTGLQLQALHSSVERSPALPLFQPAARTTVRTAVGQQPEPCAATNRPSYVACVPPLSVSCVCVCVCVCWCQDVVTGHPDAFTNKTFVFSGVLSSLYRDTSKDLVLSHGGRVTGQCVRECVCVRAFWRDNLESGGRKRGADAPHLKHT